jgi:hypothetical protein
MGEIWGAAIAAVGAVGGGYLASQGSKKAAKAASAGEATSVNEARRQFDLVRGDTAGQRFLGDSAIDRLSRLYGYGPVPQGYGAGPAGTRVANAPRIADDGFFNTGAGAILNPWTVTSQLGTAGKILDPLGGVFGNLFGNKHGDEKRNYEAFFRDNDVYDLGNGKYALSDGTTFNEGQLKDVAGTWYGATYAPDGGQDQWQQRWSDLQGRLGKTPMGQSASAPGIAPATSGAPDMSAFFESPDYQFRLNEGQKAIDRSASARGGLLSGGAQKEGIRYASNLASGEYASFIDRLMQQAGLGSTGIGASASAGANTAGIVSDAARTGAATRAGAYMTGAAGINNSLQGGLQSLLLAKYLGGS